MQNVKPGKQLRIQGKQLQKTGETTGKHMK